MKKLTLLLFLVSIFAFSLNISTLWDSDYIELPMTGYVQGSGIAVKQTGDIHIITKDGYYYVINRLGNITGKYGTPEERGWKHISYPVIVSSNYIVYVTSDYDGKSRIYFRSNTTSNYYELSGNISRSLTAFLDGNNIHVYVGLGSSTFNGVYHIVYDTSSGTVTTTNDKYQTEGPVEIAPILSPKKDSLFVLDSKGNFYNIALDSSYDFDTTTVNAIKLGGTFETPMAYSEGFIFAISREGTLYRIPPEGTNSDVDFIKLGSSSMAAGVLVDSKNYIFVFDDLGTIHIVQAADDLLKQTSYSVVSDFEGYRFATTPLLFKKSDENKIYMFVLLNNDPEKKGKVVIYSMDYDTYEISKEWEKDIDDTFPLIGSPAMVPLSSINEENYIIAFSTIHDRIYAYLVDAKGPYGFWAMEGQNSYRTGFVDSNAPTFRTSITLVTKDRFSGLELSKENLNDANGKYGLVYDATVVSISDSGDISTYTTEEYVTNPNTNNSDQQANDKIPSGRAGLDKLLVKFSTDTTLTLLFNDSFIKNITNDVIPAPIVDATYSFRQFSSGIPGYEAPYLESKEATIVFGYDDKIAEVLADSTFAILVKYNFPSSDATELLEFGKDETSKTIDAYNSSKVSIPSGTFAYKWKVYQWDDNLQGYSVYDYKSIDKLTLGVDDTKRAPTYVEIYYTDLPGTVTFVVPMYAESETRAFILIDAAKGALSTTLYATLTSPELSMSLSTITSVEVAPNFSVEELLTKTDEDYIKMVFVENSYTEISKDTRVATISLWLKFDQPALLYFQNEAKFFDLFNIELYTQLKNNPVEKELYSKNKFIANKYLTLPGDFNLDGVVDDDDYVMFRTALINYVENGIYDPKYDIGPRKDFSPPNRGFIPGFSERDGKIDEMDLNVFLVMFGYTPPSTDIEYSGN